MERHSNTTSNEGRSRRRLRVIVDLWEDSAELADIFPMTNSDEGDRKVRKIIAEDSGRSYTGKGR